MEMTYIYLFFSVIIGVAIILFFNPIKSKNLQLLITFSGAYLLSITFLHLIPELFNSNNSHEELIHSHNHAIGIYILLGFLIQTLLEYFSKGIEHGHLHSKNVISFSVLISLCIHALLEGMSLAKNQDPLLYAIVIHKIPIAAVLTIFFLQSGIKKQKTYFLLFLFALMSPIGLFISKRLTSVGDYLHIITAIVIGIFIHISTTILFESTEGHKLTSRKIITILMAVIIAYLSIHE